MHLSEIWHSKKNDCRLSRTQVINNVDSPELFAFHIYGTEADTDGIQNINYNRDVDCPKAVYDLQGRRIHDNSYRGVRIEDGRLVVGQ